MIRLKKINLAKSECYLDKGSVMYEDAGKTHYVQPLHCAGI